MLIKIKKQLLVIKLPDLKTNNKIFWVFNYSKKITNIKPRPKPNMIIARQIGAILVTISIVLIYNF